MIAPLAVWVVSLRRSGDRRDLMDRQLRRIGLPYRFHDAVDGKALSHDQRRLYSRRLAIATVGRELSPSEIGCALSHLGVYQDMLVQGICDLLVLEDDAVIEPSFLDALSRRDAFPADWELINWFSDVPRTPLRPAVSVGRYSVCTFDHPPNRTGAYSLKASGARKLISCGFPVRMAADGLTGRFMETDVRVYGVSPNAATSTDAPSTIWVQGDRPEHLQHARSSLLWRARILIARWRGRYPGL